MLSGFLISGLLFREYQRRGSLALPRFWVRRGLRIYPAFCVLLLCTWLAFRYFRVPRTSGTALLAEVFFLQNYLGGMWNHTWSLAVEEHFYLALPLLLLALARIGRTKRDPFRAVVPLGAAVMLGLAVLRCINAWQLPYTHGTHLYPTHLRFDSLLAGVLLAYAYQFHRPDFDRLVTPRRRFLCFAGTACFLPAFLFGLETAWFVPTLGLTLFACGSVLLIAAGHGVTPPLPARLLAPMGVHSYSTYLWHMPMVIWGLPICEHLLQAALDPGVRIVIYLVGSLVVGAAMNRIAEEPLLRLRDRWFPSQAEGRTQVLHLPDRRKELKRSA